MSNANARRAVDELGHLHELATSVLNDRGELGVDSALLALAEMESRLAQLLNQFPVLEVKS